MMKRTAWAASLAILTGALAQAQTPAETFADGLAEYRRSHHIPSLSVLVLRDGEPEVEAYLGWSDDEGEVATDADTAYFVASVTKTITGTTLFLADQAGEIDFDRPMSDAEDWRGLCEWFPDSDIPLAGGDVDGVMFPDFTCQGQTLRQVVNMQVNGEPGTDFYYNALVFARLGRFVDEVHDRDFRSLVRGYVIDPLEMTDTMAGWRDMQNFHVLSHLAPPFEFDGERLVKQPFPDDDFRGAAGLYMTPLDLGRFDRALDDGALLTAEQREALWTPPNNADGTPSEYAHGWFLQEYNGERLVFHSGWQPDAYSAIYLKLPDRGLTLIAFANTESLWWGNRADRSEVDRSDLVQAFFAAYGVGEEAP
ncbi:Beta-lactamase [Oceanicaulis sp. 350]|nr:Beta-lactamase [Oceanicaulis sp. 350]